jgi:integrase
MSVINKGINEWRIKVMAGHLPNGNKKFITETFIGTKAEASSREAEIKVKAGRGDFTDTKLTVSKFYELRYLPWLEASVAKGDRKPNTAEYYKTQFRVHIIPYLGNIKISELGVYNVEMFLDSIKSDGTRRASYITLKTALRQAELWGMIKRSPMDYISKPKDGSAPKDDDSKHYTIEEAQAILGAIHGEQTEPLIILALCCGLRRGEVCGLNCQDLDFKARMVRVQRQYTTVRGVPVLDTPKSRSSIRYYPLEGYAYDRLKELCSRRIGPLVSTSGGNRIEPHNVLRSFQRICANNNIRVLPFHALRHTAGTLMAEDTELDRGALSKGLGHSSERVTFDVYVHSKVENLRPSVGRYMDKLVPDITLGESSKSS